MVMIICSFARWCYHRKITVNKDNKAIVSDTSADSSGILTTQSYTVKITEYNGDGTIKTITIEE